MAHESTFGVVFGGFALVAAGDLVESEIELSRQPLQPTRSNPIRGDFSTFRQGLNLSHTLAWTIRREFGSIAAARAWEWQRPAALPKGRQTLVLTDSGVTATLSDAHLSGHSLVHVRGAAGTILESCTVIGGEYAVSGGLVEPDWPDTPDEPIAQPVPGLDWILDTGSWRDGARWRDTARWQDN